MRRALPPQVAAGYEKPGWAPPQRRADANLTAVSHVLRNPPVCFGLGHCEAPAMQVRMVTAVLWRRSVVRPER